jgi:hypothetical protein
MLRLFEGVASAVSVVLFLSWLFLSLPFLSWLLFRRAAFFVVADSHSNNFATRCLFPSRHSLIAICCRFRRGCFFVVANSHSNNLPVANRQSPLAAV